MSGTTRFGFLVILALPGLTQASELDQLWRYAELYNNDENPFVQKITLSGRLQGEIASFSSNQGSYQDSLWRRFRFGAKAQLSGDWEIHVEGNFDLNEDLDDSYGRLTDAKLTWSPKDKDWKLKLLKQSAGFTLDGATSSKNLLTLQRNNLTNNLWFTAEYFSGVSLSGSYDQGLEYNIAVFSSDGADEIGFSQASYFTLLSLGYDFSSDLAIDHALFRVDYVYNDEHIDANTREFSQVLSLTTQLQQGRWGLSTDLALGDGYAEQADVYGLVLMPHYDVSEQMQLVARYTWMEGRSAQSLRFGRYEGDIAQSRGDEYREIYGGLNIYFYGHKLKWQTGVQYTDMRDESGSEGDYYGWGITSGIRLSW